MPDADANFGVSLDLYFSTWWRHVKTMYISHAKTTNLGTISGSSFVTRLCPLTLSTGSARADLKFCNSI